MISGGTLLLLAEISRIIRITRHSIPMRCLPPKNYKVAQVLEQVGINNLLRSKVKVRPIAHDVVSWRAANGHLAEGEKYNDILGHYDGVISENLKTGLYLGLTEAMTNTNQHAYEKERQDGLNYSDQSKDWWMFSQKKDGKLSVVFCDLGIGIPTSLPLKNPGLWKKLKKKLGNPADGECIREAVEATHSRTGQHHRGKGLKQLVSTIDKIKGGRLIIFSNHGCYVMRDGEENVYNMKNSILGTLISWSLPLEESQ